MFLQEENLCDIKLPVYRPITFFFNPFPKIVSTFQENNTWVK